VFSGDEPHHLVNISSLLRDGDFDLTNNYAAARGGGDALGARFSGIDVDHHTVWFLGGERHLWRDVYGIGGVRWLARGDPAVALPRTGKAPYALSPERPEYSQHPQGIALLTAPLLLPFRSTQWIEPLALLLTAVFVMCGLMACGRLLSLYAIDGATIWWTVLLCLCASPLWHYARTLFGEAHLFASCAVGFSLALASRKPAAAGVAFGLGILIKPVILLVPLPLCCLFAWKRDWRSFLRFSAPILAFVLAYFAMNTHMFGAPWRTAQSGVHPHSLFDNAFGWEHGLFTFVPAVLLGAIGWRRLYRRALPESQAILGGAALYLSYALLFLSGGNHCFGPRYATSVLPFLLLGLAGLRFQGLSFPARLGAASLLVISLVINGLAAIHSWAYWSTHPFLALGWLPHW